MEDCDVRDSHSHRAAHLGCVKRSSLLRLQHGVNSNSSNSNIITTYLLLLLVTYYFFSFLYFTLLQSILQCHLATYQHTSHWLPVTRLPVLLIQADNRFARCVQRNPLVHRIVQRFDQRSWRHAMKFILVPIVGPNAAAHLSYRLRTNLWNHPSGTTNLCQAGSGSQRLRLRLSLSLSWILIHSWILTHLSLQVLLLL